MERAFGYKCSQNHRHDVMYFRNNNQDVFESIKRKHLKGIIQFKLKIRFYLL